MKAVVTNPLGAEILTKPYAGSHCISAEPVGSIVEYIETDSDLLNYYSVVTPECMGYVYKEDVSIIEERKDVLFKCDGSNEICRNSVTCYKNGGECCYTSNIEYALNFEKKESGSSIYYCEKDMKFA